MKTSGALLDHDPPVDVDTGVDVDPPPLRPFAAHLEELGELIDDVVAVDKQLAATAAARALAIDAARLCAEQADIGVSAFERDLNRRSLVAELACALRIPEVTASNLVELSRGLVHTLPSTLDALRKGEISYRHASIMVDQASGLPTEVAREMERLALPPAGRLTPSQFERKARKIRETMQPESIVERHERSVADRSVEFSPARDGMAWLTQYLPAADALAIYTQVTSRAIALQGPSESRTLTQLRSDVLRDLILNPDGTESGRFSGITPELIVTVPMLTLLGMDDRPADLNGYGPIDPETARELAAKCPSCVRILTDPETGAVLSMGHDKYVVPAALRRMLAVRDGTCRFPGCSRSAAHSDIDHTVDWAHGGNTDHNNLAHLCPKNHAFKHEAGWTLTQEADGSGLLTWTTPTGHQYITEPETVFGSAICAEKRKGDRHVVESQTVDEAAVEEAAVEEAAVEEPAVEEEPEAPAAQPDPDPDAEEECPF